MTCNAARRGHAPNAAAPALRANDGGSETGSHCDRSMLRPMNDPGRRRPYATAARRRLAVAAIAVLMLPWMFATGVIYGATRGLLELRERTLDE